MDLVLKRNIILLSRISTFLKYPIHTSTEQNAPKVSKTQVKNREAAHPSLRALKVQQNKKTFKKSLPTDFAEFDLRTDVLDALTNIDISRPSQIQALAIPEIIQGKNVCLAAETGSGKTLAYLVPIINLLKHELDELNIQTKLLHPRALILVPTAELCLQVLAVAKSLAHVVKFRSAAIYKGMTNVRLKSALENPIDLLVSTPMTLHLQRKYRKLSLYDLSYVVFDELDTLFDSSFTGINGIILKSLNIRPSPLAEEGVQAVVSGASLSSEIKKRIIAQIPDLDFIRSDGLHKVLPHVEQRFHRCLNEDKEKVIIKILINNPRLKTIIFCNTIDSVEWLCHHLKNNNISALRIHGGLPDFERNKIVEQFQHEQHNIIIGTDIMSRGIDTRTVKHVIMFDFPFQPLDYLHRVGRTGRLNPLHVEGKIQFYQVSVLVVKRRDARLAEDLKRASRKDRPLDLFARGWK